MSVVKEALRKAAEEAPLSDRGTPTPTPSPSASPGPILTAAKLDEEAESALMGFISDGDWAAVLNHARQNRSVPVPVDVKAEPFTDENC